MENVINNEESKVRKDYFPLYASLIGIVAGAIVLGPIYFLIITSFTRRVTQNGKIKTVMAFQKQYIIGVCIVALIVCGILFILCISTLVYHFIKKRNEKVEA